MGNPQTIFLALFGGYGM